ncbi:hypothetical protein [Rubellimicrobium arenae]|uniref:hypothetical protein n=1 Tax=Rubellimicrobium arenae TaxID=2817372 RepID=UPI001B31436A|nr:hypothetical protein [Rubellimicrobium arenae]
MNALVPYAPQVEDDDDPSVRYAGADDERLDLMRRLYAQEAQASAERARAARRREHNLRLLMLTSLPGPEHDLVASLAKLRAGS